MIKILVPTDFSKTSKKALDFACFLGNNTKVEIQMLHVMKVPSRSGTKLIHKMRELAKEEDEQIVKSKTKKFMDQKHVPSSLNKKTVIRYGDVSKQVINFSLQEDFDLIVMGTKGVSWMKEAFMGSNTFSTLKLSMIPTIVVPRAYEPEKRTDSACIALRFDKLYSSSCAKLIKKCRLFGYNPELFTVVDNKSDELDLSVKYKRKSYPVKIVKNQRPRKAISKFIKENKSGLLALHFNAYSFFKELTFPSVSSEFTFRSKIPILFMK